MTDEPNRSTTADATTDLTHAITDAVVDIVSSTRGITAAAMRAGQV